MENELKEKIIISLKNLNIVKNDNVYIASDLRPFALIRISKKRKLEIIIESIMDVIGNKGSIFSPSASMNLCNTNIPFDVSNTPSYQMGSLSEYIRQIEGSVRSMHPFWSVSGIGSNSHILKNVSKHSYGFETPWSRFLNIGVKQINFGIHPSRAVTLIHHIETIMGVPYRYNKEFIHPIIYNGNITMEKFYMSVFYKNSDAKKRILLNEHFFEELQKSKKLKQENIDNMKIWCFEMNDFHSIVTKMFVKDIYTYLENEPTKKPYLV
tara:strand:- start:943 stop:1743 length:801 start_codon:yes stop_codon:yes gene_type:complete